ncbi:hypothetical protein BY458DRAFT_435746 [Sporodiniella umbellata]|nr:hypothetical protein BY458DRAFT_435746 [Sporodiniella umbellata]
MEGDQTIITKPPEHKGNSRDTEDIKAFTFDKSYWSFDKKDPKYADQQSVYDDLGVDLLNHAFDGYNCCIFAYGQTGAGKSYSMMGYGEDKGIIPMTCSELFERIAENGDSNLTYRAEVSYIEIYNEKVHDLLNPKNKGNLKVREHPSTGPYVEDLSRLVVKSFDDINHLMDEGNKARTVAATQMNETSSRSHAVFTVFLTQIRIDELTKLATEKVARISLVDLAGSERANSTGATGARLKEGANINRSLTTLGKVISGLADQSTSKGKKGKESFIPYRDSVLTWLLKDSLGGNSKTAMIAAISPADYDETLSTLRYADQAKKIQNKAVVNEDPNAKMIRELKDELSVLRDRLRVYAPEIVEELNANSSYKSQKDTKGSITQLPKVHSNQTLTIEDSNGQKKEMTKEEILEQLQSSSKLLEDLKETWEEKLKKTEEIHSEREKALKDLGITIDKTVMGLRTPKKQPFIVNLNEDPLMSECLMYQIKQGKTRVGKQDDKSQCEIRLSGQDILEEHCYFEYVDNIVVLHPIHKQALTMVNGVRITEPRKLKSGYRIILGHRHIFRFNHPEEVRRERSDMARSSTPNTDRTDSPIQVVIDEGTDLAEWNYARLEAMKNHYSAEANFDGLKDYEIEKMYDSIARERQTRRTRVDSRTGLDYDDDVISHKRLSVSVTVVDDGSVCTDSTLVSPAIQEKLKGIQEQHKKELDLQRSFYETKMNRMSAMFQIQAPLSQRELDLSRKVIKQWRRLHYVSMAELVLSHAALLKEANAISLEFEKETTYQFTIIEGLGHLKSQWEESYNSQFIEEDEALMASTEPRVAVRVIDKKNLSVYFWSLENLKVRVEKMRQLRNSAQHKHLSQGDPFYETQKSLYSFIGNASVSVRNLVEQQAYESSVEILCKMTGQVKGTLRLMVSPIARSGSEDLRQTLEVGQQLLFEIRLQELAGLNDKEFTDVHVQFRLSSFGGLSPHTSLDRLFTTQPVEQMSNTMLLDYSQTLSILVTEPVIEILKNKMISFEIYGKAQPRILSQYERWDDQREKPQLDEMLVGSQRMTRATSSSTLNESRSQPDPIEEKHDILAWIQLCELMPNGEYKPVQVVTQAPHDRGVFQLKQGLQRRICITLSHTSGKQLVWNKITKAVIGQVRLVDTKNRVIPSPAHEDIAIRLLHSKHEVEYKQDGTSTLTAQGSWDSSQHDCLFLNRLTSSNTRILLNLKWEIEAEKCLKPIQCQMDIAVRIQGRDASQPFRLFRLLGSTRYLSKCSGIFMVHLRPPMTRRASQLWRLNTASKVVPGEEYLGSWRPRGVSLINDFKRIQARIERKELVSRIAQTLMLHTARSQTSQRSMSTNKSESSQAQTELIKRILSIWNQRWGSDKEIILSQDPPIPGMREVSKGTNSRKKLISEVKMITEIEHTTTKKGYLVYQENPLINEWVKRWFVLRR